MLVRQFLSVLPPLYGPLFLLFLLWAVGQVGAGQRRRRRDKLAASGLAEIDVMDGRRFERYLHARFTQLGYAVELTPYQGDWGADLVLCKDGVKTVVQAKLWRRPVGVTAVQEVVAAKGMYAGDHALVVTNSRFTDAAKTLARANGVELWNRERLIQELLAVKPASNVAPQAVSNTDISAMPVRAAVLRSPLSIQTEASAACAQCGKPVTGAVASYCYQRAERFDGRVYCFDHQRGRARQSTPAR